MPAVRFLDGLAAVLIERRAVSGAVSGRVQGVFYRASFQREALSRGLVGWVRNLPDGRVAFAVQGDADDVQRLLDWARQGPPRARVDHLEVSETDYDAGLRGFDVLT